METPTNTKAKLTYYPEETRGRADYGWLKARYSFSFSQFFSPARMQFGALRVLNDDRIAGGMGFGTHPHENMEIVTIPLKGAIAHKDSTGGEGTIHPNEVQAMSAGSGVQHSEFNPLRDVETNLLQVWVLPKELNIDARYAEAKFKPEDRVNQWQIMVSPLEEDQAKGALWINQDARFARVDLAAGKSLDYSSPWGGNGYYLFVISGKVSVLGQALKQRDALGIEQAETVRIEASEDAELLMIDVPMQA